MAPEVVSVGRYRDLACLTRGERQEMYAGILKEKQCMMTPGHVKVGFECFFPFFFSFPFFFESFNILQTKGGVGASWNDIRVCGPRHGGNASDALHFHRSARPVSVEKQLQGRLDAALCQGEFSRCLFV